MMKRLFALWAAALVLAACGGKEDAFAPSAEALAGIWELNSIETKAVSVGDVSVSVYLEFSAQNTFLLFQKIGEGRYAQHSGNFTLSTDGKLSGKYSNNAVWGPYSVEIQGNTLSLTSAGDKEVDHYIRISAIPPSVTENLY